MVEEQKNEEFKHFIRIVSTDLEGIKPISHALLKIKGIGFMYANMLCNINKIDRFKKAGYLTKEEVDKLENSLRGKDSKIPVWMKNRRLDYEDGEDKHLLIADLKFTNENDIKNMKKIKTRRGYRHSFNLPVRGQSMRSNFRKNKGKVTGVTKRKVAAAAGTAAPKK